MNPLKLLVAEIRYRKVNFGLSLFAVTVAVTLLVAGPILVDGYARQTDEELTVLETGVQEAASQVAQSETRAAAELARLEDDTRKAMLRLGFNLIILHGGTDMSEFWATGFPTLDMDEKCVGRLARDPRLTMVTHVVGTLRAKVKWGDRTVGLVGYLPEASASHSRQRAPMGYQIQPGTVFLGCHLANGQNQGDTIDVLGQPLRIARILPEMGSEEDSTIAMHLSDAQAVLKRPGRVNQIMALDCRCAEADLPKIRKQVADILPECFVSQINARSVPRTRQRALVREEHEQVLARHKQDLAVRKQHLAETAASRARIQGTIETLASVVTLLVVAAAAVWVGLMALANVRERLTEIGLLRALGKGSGTIASLLLGRAVLLGFLGGVLGLLLGTGVGWLLEVRAMGLAAEQFAVPLGVLLTALVGAPLLSAVASYLPTLSALAQDPAVVLREQ
jgi:putative ABC transport system permease protein